MIKTCSVNVMHAACVAISVVAFYSAALPVGNAIKRCVSIQCYYKR